MENLQLIDTIAEIDMQCDKIKALASRLLNEYETTDGAEPKTTALTATAINSEKDTEGYNAVNFICGYNEIIQFIRIINDYVWEISNTAKEAVKH